MKLAVTGSRILVLRALQKAANAAVAIVIMQGLGPVGNGRYSLTVTIVTVLAAVLAGGVGLASVPFLRRQTPAPWRVHRAQLLWFALVAGILVLAVGAVRSTSVWTWLQRELTWNEILLACAAATVLAMLVFETANYSLLAAGRVVQGTAVAAIRTLALMVILGTILVLGRLQFAVAFLVFAVLQIATAVVLLGSSRRAIRAGTHCSR